MNVKQLIDLLNQVSNKESEVFMWSYTESTDEYLSINSVNIEIGDGDIVLSPTTSHKISDLTLTTEYIQQGNEITKEVFDMLKDKFNGK
jgi:hypothetical protein